MQSSRRMWVSADSSHLGHCNQIKDTGLYSEIRHREESCPGKSCCHSGGPPTMRLEGRDCCLLRRGPCGTAQTQHCGGGRQPSPPWGSSRVAKPPGWGGVGREHELLPCWGSSCLPSTEVRGWESGHQLQNPWKEERNLGPGSNSALCQELCPDRQHASAWGGLPGSPWLREIRSRWPWHSTLTLTSDSGSQEQLPRMLTVTRRETGAG